MSAGAVTVEGDGTAGPGEEAPVFNLDLMAAILAWTSFAAGVGAAAAGAGDAAPCPLALALMAAILSAADRAADGAEAAAAAAAAVGAAGVGALMPILALIAAMRSAASLFFLSRSSFPPGTGDP